MEYRYQITFILFYCLTAVTVFSVLYYTIKINITKNKIKKEAEEAVFTLAENFKILRQEIEDQANKLEKKDVLSLEENINYKKLKAALDSSESYINKEIKDISKALK
ncbi:MAG: hypothetical protein WCX77_03760 [Candidatus Paceibacterota bacterium]|jgi:hypothetical protein